jgi:hut operon positive regulator
MFEVDNLSVARAAILLSMSRTRKEEDEIKDAIISQGMRCCVTEAGGVQENFKSKMVRNTLGMALANNVIVKNYQNVHALMHAVLEAETALLLNADLISSIAVKIAVVRDDEWICVSIFGDCAMHMVCHHERSGLGVMHLGAD